MITLALGIDIGGTNTTWGLADREGHIHAKGAIPTRGEMEPALFLQRLHRAVAPAIRNLRGSRVDGIGIGAPNGNFYTGEIAFAPNLPWQGVIPLAQLAREIFALPAVVTNDANAAAIGEMTYGAARNMKDFILVTLGTGLGSGFVANGRLIYGHDGFAGELGHVIAERDGRVCGCGRKGCLERYASATGIAITAAEWLSDAARHSVLRDHQGKISAWHIHQAAIAGDALALELFEYTGRILGQTLADTVAITSPEAIIFFGGVARAGDYLLDPVRRHMEANMLNIFQNKVKLLLSSVADQDAAILGAAALVWHQ
jgi:glucokinase